MPPFCVVEIFDLFSDHGACILKRFEALARQQFEVQRAEEAFHRSVVAGVACAAHATLDLKHFESAHVLALAVDTTAIQSSAASASWSTWNLHHSNKL